MATLPTGTLAPTQSEQTSSKKAVSLIDSLLSTPTLPQGASITPTVKNVQTKEILATSDSGKFLLKSHGVGKYGRVLGEIFVKGQDKSVNELLIENGHAYEYEGGKKKVFGS